MNYTENSEQSKKNETIKLRIQALDINKAMKFKAHLISDFLSFTPVFQEDKVDNSFNRIIQNEMSLLTNETLAFSQLQTLTETPSHYSDSAIGIPMQINCVVKSTAVDSIGRLKSDYKNEFTGKILNLLI